MDEENKISRYSGPAGDGHINTAVHVGVTNEAIRLGMASTGNGATVEDATKFAAWLSLTEDLADDNLAQLVDMLTHVGRMVRGVPEHEMAVHLNAAIDDYCDGIR